ncbi:MAG TPA: type 4a pilus biogenesis protein PilO [Candidatus Saccharimonadales bacterium]|jgi:hypothetical protein|nr:type 4a pilus biogenesis protein PilO [Candidatus Saccharimonadales bacterium]
MNKKINFNIKISKAKARAITFLAIASFLLIFALFTSKTLLRLYVYQDRVLAAQQTSISNITKDQQVANSVVNAYKTFVNQPINIIGGPSSGTSTTSGNNAKIILDALPQTYDFPALMSSLQALLTIPGVTIDSLSGTDSSLTITQSESPTPIPIAFSVTGSYTSIQNFLSTLNKSVSPIDVLSMELSGTDSDLTATITAQTYIYNPSTGILTNTEVIQ